MKLREELREELAGAAPAGLLASGDTDEASSTARVAYEYAHAMLAHRDANPLPASAGATEPKLCAISPPKYSAR